MLPDSFSRSKFHLLFIFVTKILNIIRKVKYYSSDVIETQEYRISWADENLRTRKNSSDKTLLTALDESMENIFGKSATRAVYYFLEENYSLKLEDIPEKPQIFAKAIEEIFGDTGANVIETLLVNDLLSQLGIKNQGKEMSKLVNCLSILKTTYVKK